MMNFFLIIFAKSNDIDISKEESDQQDQINLRYSSI
jgi:hypothetical protein